MYSIGELSRRTGVKVPTIRYYEQMGLMPEGERTQGNQRRYRRDELERLAFIRHARDLGPVEMRHCVDEFARRERGARLRATRRGFHFGHGCSSHKKFRHARKQ